MNKKYVIVVTVISIATILLLLLVPGAYRNAPYVDLGGSVMGWNWFSLMCFCIMGIYTLKRVSKIYEKSVVPKVSKILLVLMSSFCALLFFYTFFDLMVILFSRSFVLMVQGSDPIPYIVEFVMQHFMPNIFPANWITVTITFGVTFLLLRNYINFKFLPLILIAFSVIDIFMLAFYGTYNMRTLQGDLRVLLYYTAFVPSWVLHVLLFIKLFWRDKEN